MSNILFKGLYGTLFLTPIISFLFRRALLKIRIYVLVGGCIMTAFLILSYITDISLIGVSADILFIYATYFVIGLGFIQLTTYNKTPVKIAGYISVIPLILLPIASIGAIFWVMLIGGDLMPVYQQSTPEGNICRVTSYGNATSSNGGYVAIEYEPYLVLEMPKHEISIDNTRKEHVTPEFACNLLK